jgi:hypothetical protein
MTIDAHSTSLQGRAHRHHPHQHKRVAFGEGLISQQDPARTCVGTKPRNKVSDPIVGIALQVEADP